MSSIASLIGDRVSPRKLVVLVGLSLALPFIALAQQGQDAVYNSSGQVTNSPAFIDASMFASSVQNPNFCSVLNWVLNPKTTFSLPPELSLMRAVSHIVLRLPA
jgi:hypothetical protein